MKMTESSQKRVENSVGKGEITIYEQFLLFPQSLQKACNAIMKITRACLREGKSIFKNNLWKLSRSRSRSTCIIPVT